MCFCWCVTEINYKMHGATVKTKMCLKVHWVMCDTVIQDDKNGETGNGKVGRIEN